MADSHVAPQKQSYLELDWVLIIMYIIIKRIYNLQICTWYIALNENEELENAKLKKIIEISYQCMYLYFVMLKLAYSLMFIDKFMNILSSNNMSLLYLFSMLLSTLV